MCGETHSAPLDRWDMKDVHEMRVLHMSQACDCLHGTCAGVGSADCAGLLRCAFTFEFTFSGHVLQVHSTAAAPLLLVSTAQHSTAQHSTAQHSTAQHSTAQHSTAQHSTAQHSTAQHSTARHSTAQHSTAVHTCATDKIGLAKSSLRHRDCKIHTVQD